VQEKLSLLFKEREIKKTYEALVWGKMGLSGKFEKPIGRDPVQRNKISSRSRYPRSAMTLWERIACFGMFSHVRLQPQTGRTHQLRVHLSEGGFPIVGDPVYRRGLSPGLFKNVSPVLTEIITTLPHTLLHAKSLSFLHPMTGKEMFLEAPKPEIWNTVFNALPEKI
jgi:23S rRNA pseudouridine1911/1915/1917 synthase